MYSCAYAKLCHYFQSFLRHFQPYVPFPCNLFRCDYGVSVIWDNSADPLLCFTGVQVFAVCRHNVDSRNKSFTKLFRAWNTPEIWPSVISVSPWYSMCNVIEWIICLLTPDVRDWIIRISINSLLWFLCCMTSSLGFQVSPVSKITSKCFASQSLLWIRNAQLSPWCQKE